MKFAKALLFNLAGARQWDSFFLEPAPEPNSYPEPAPEPKPEPVRTLGIAIEISFLEGLMGPLIKVSFIFLSDYIG